MSEETKPFEWNIPSDCDDAVPTGYLTSNFIIVACFCSEADPRCRVFLTRKGPYPRPLPGSLEFIKSLIILKSGLPHEDVEEILKHMLKLFEEAGAVTKYDSDSEIPDYMKIIILNDNQEDCPHSGG
jgi:hypothetical protein